MDGEPLNLKGASWFGADGTGRAPDGLWVHNVTYYMRFLSQHGFNGLRLPLALDNVAANIGPEFNMIRAQPSWRRLDYLTVIERIVQIAADHGFLVLLDLQRLKSNEWPDAGLWYRDDISLETVKQTWDTLQQHFCNHWNVFGADVLNEPHGARWPEWARTASELGNFVLSRCSRWTIFVEGVAHKGLKSSAGEYFWGENLAEAGQTPVRLSLSNKIVYSPHAYGPGDGGEDHHMPYFDASDFPNNMNAIWHRHFGYLCALGATVVVGEWGGFFRGKDRLWQETFARYLKSNKLSSFYWSLNPNSQDTGGLLTSTWSQPESGKLSLLEGLPSTRILALVRGRQAFTCPVEVAGPLYDCGSGQCLLGSQVCNGVPECPDQSDEGSCHGVPRPCVTVSAGHSGKLCVFPFKYNGYTYDRCTLVDADKGWELVEDGRCQAGYLPSLALHGESLAACQMACAQTSGCEFVSHTSAAGGFCGGYTTACAQMLLTDGVTGYQTYRRTGQGGAWCPTRVDDSGNYIGGNWAGTCGAGCEIAQGALDPYRSRCEENGKYSDGGPAHCGSSPPPPPALPPPLPPPFEPPTRPPPAPPPSPFPPVRLAGLELLIALDDELLVAVIAACILLCVCACICWAKIRQNHWDVEVAHHRRRNPALRKVDEQELQALAGPSHGRRPSKPIRASSGYSHGTQESRRHARTI